MASLIAPAIKLLGYELVACELIPQGRRVLLRVYIDSVEGVTIRDCEIVSRQISAVLDVEDPISGGYYLEVSSPGADRLLVTEEHYQHFIGQRIRVKLSKARNGRSHYTGTLQAVQNGNITLIVEGEGHTMSISEIEKSKLVPDN